MRPKEGRYAPENRSKRLQRPRLRFSWDFFFGGGGHSCGMRKFPGQRWNPRCSSDLSHCGDNAGSLTCSATRDSRPSRDSYLIAGVLHNFWASAQNKHLGLFVQKLGLKMTTAECQTNQRPFLMGGPLCWPCLAGFCLPLICLHESGGCSCLTPQWKNSGIFTPPDSDPQMGRKSFPLFQPEPHLLHPPWVTESWVIFLHLPPTFRVRSRSSAPRNQSYIGWHLFIPPSGD